jgi:hypothetical protein
MSDKGRDSLKRGTQTVSDGSLLLRAQQNAGNSKSPIHVHASSLDAFGAAFWKWLGVAFITPKPTLISYVPNLICA